MLNQTQLVLAVAGVLVIAAVLLVLGRRRRRAEEQSDGRPDAQVALEAVLVDEPGTLVLARTHDGTQYQGTLTDATAANARGAYLTLAGPIVFRRAGGEPETMPSAWDRLALPLADVAEVWTRSAPTVEPAAAAAPSQAPAPAATESTEDVVARLREGADEARRERRTPVTTP
jgi:LPXTG-motif cell wall-anchored protein